jgi:hypothetical protein
MGLARLGAGKHPHGREVKIVLTQRVLEPVALAAKSLGPMGLPLPAEHRTAVFLGLQDQQGSIRQNQVIDLSESAAPIRQDDIVQGFGLKSTQQPLDPYLAGPTGSVPEEKPDKEHEGGEDRQPK